MAGSTDKSVTNVLVTIQHKSPDKILLNPKCFFGKFIAESFNILDNQRVLYCCHRPYLGLGKVAECLIVENMIAEHGTSKNSLVHHRENGRTVLIKSRFVRSSFSATFTSSADISELCLDIENRIHSCTQNVIVGVVIA